MSEDARIESRTVATLALTARRSNLTIRLRRTLHIFYFFHYFDIVYTSRPIILLSCQRLFCIFFLLFYAKYLLYLFQILPLFTHLTPKVFYMVAANFCFASFSCSLPKSSSCLWLFFHFSLIRSTVCIGSNHERLNIKLSTDLDPDLRSQFSYFSYFLTRFMLKFHIVARVSGKFKMQFLSGNRR